MAEIIQFPTRPDREWQEVDATIRIALAQNGYGKDAIEEIARNTKERTAVITQGFAKLPEFSIPMEFAPPIKECIEMLQASVTLALGEVFKLETELYALRNK